MRSRSKSSEKCYLSPTFVVIFLVELVLSDTYSTLCQISNVETTETPQMCHDKTSYYYYSHSQNTMIREWAGFITSSKKKKKKNRA